MCGVDTIYCPAAHILFNYSGSGQKFTGTADADGVTEAAVDQGRFKEDKIFFTR